MPTGPGSTISGVYSYGEDDSTPLFSDMLNKLGDSVRTMAGDFGWIAPTGYATNWSGYAPDATWSALNYRKLGQTVHLNGGLRSTAAWSASVTVFTLPVGYRPARLMRIPLIVGAQAGYLRILPDGTVAPSVASSGGDYFQVTGSFPIG